MPAMVRRREGKFRVVEPSDSGDVKLVRGPSRQPVDGGGFRVKRSAERQARAINANQQGDK